MSNFGTGSNSNGQFWYGSATNFPGFLYKKNVGVGGRRSTKMNPGGNITCNKSTYLYNKYKPGTGGVGASSISNRRAKNRLATVCQGNKCFPCYTTLGQYSNYTHNPNGFIPCPYIPLPPPPPPPVCNTYQQGSPWPFFRGLTNEANGISPNAGPALTVFNTPTKSILSQYDFTTSTNIIDKNGNIYTCGRQYRNTTNGLYSISTKTNSLNWQYPKIGDPPIGSTEYAFPVIGCDGTIYFCDDTFMYAINPDGTLKWKTNDIGDGSDNCPIIVNNKIYCGTTTGLWEVTDTGSANKRIVSTDINGFNGYNLSSDGKILFIPSSTYLYAIDLTTNTIIWDSSTVTALNAYSFSLYTTPAIDSKYIYIYASTDSQNNNYILKIKKSNGSLIGSFSTVDICDDTSPVLDKNGYLYIGTNGTNGTGKFYAIYTKDMTAHYTYPYPDANYNYASPILDKNGIIYFIDQYNDILYASNTPDIRNPTKIYLNGGLKGYCTPLISDDGTLYVSSSTNGIIGFKK